VEGQAQAMNTGFLAKQKKQFSPLVLELENASRLSAQWGGKVQQRPIQGSGWAFCFPVFSLK
jgi:hypothetical protein